MHVKRREFLGTAAASLTAAWTSPLQAALDAPERCSTDPVAEVSLGRSLRATRLGMGFGMRGWNRQSNLSRRGLDHAERVIAHAYDQGIRFFDHADLYGSHEYFARAMRGKPRDSYFVTTKIWFHPQGLPEGERPDADVAVKRFLRECQSEYIDLVQIHCMMRPDWTREMRRQMDILERLKEQGLIRAHGVSCHSLGALSGVIEEPWVDVVHARINPYGVKMDGPADQVLPVLQKIHAAGKGVIGMKIVGEGEFSNQPDKLEASIRFVVNSGVVDVMIVGFETTQDIDDFKARLAQALAG